MKRLTTLLLLLTFTSNLKCDKAAHKVNEAHIDIIITVMRIREKYPPGIEGRLKLWRDYKDNY